MSDHTTRVELTQQQDYRFLIEFGTPVPPMIGDEPAPLGHGAGPSPVQLLAAAVGNCLSDSLLFALRKFRQSPDPLHTVVHAEVGRNSEGHLRVLKMTVEMTLGVQAAGLQHLDRVLEQFETYCTVAESVGQGIPIHVLVFDANGDRIK